MKIRREIMNCLMGPILVLLENKGYVVSDYCNGEILNDPDNMYEYRKAYLKFGPLKETPEKNVGKFLGLEDMDINTLLDSDTPHGATKQFLGMLKCFNENESNACRIHLDGIDMHWYFESEVAISDLHKDQKYYTIWINCANGDSDSKLRFNPYQYEDELRLILKHIYDAVCELKENIRFTKMY